MNTFLFLYFASGLHEQAQSRAKVRHFANFCKKWKKIFFAKIEFVLYIFCKYDKMISFDGIMSIFDYVEKFLKNFES